MTSPDPGAQSGTDPSAQSGGTGTGQGDPADNNPDQTGQSAETGQGQQTPEPPATVTRAEYDALMNRLRAADQNRTKAENDLKQLRDKDLPELQKAQRDLTEALDRAVKAETDLKSARLENAFLSHNKYNWHNPKTALKNADLSKVEILDDGSVTGLDAALDALAKSDPYLIKTETKVEEPKGPSGSPGAGQGRQPDGKPNMDALASRFPALRTRGAGGRSS